MQRAAVEALGKRVILLDRIYIVVAAWLDDEDRSVRRAAVLALGGRAVLPDEVLTAVIMRLGDNDRNV